LFISDQRRDAMNALRHGTLDHHQLAADLGQPAWRVRELLYGLQRDRLVRENYDRRRRCWELTDQGTAIVNAADQLALDWTAGTAQEATK
jgi:predicted transcriptional regulator